LAESLLFPDREFAAFLFDMDGTVLTSIVAAERVWGAWARKHGLDVEAVLQRIHGRRAIETAPRSETSSSGNSVRARSDAE